ncbi:hypothetical protein LUZ60_010543 [Juncus effusus]|nr:hypothetical protein LUZ60_010543 [Juncus effusus]
MAEVETTRHRPLMPPELLKAAIEGNEQILIEMLKLEEDGGHTSVTIESSGNDELNKYLQSATFMGNSVLHVLCFNNHDLLASKVCKKDGFLLSAHNKMLETPVHCAAKGIDNKDAIFTLIEIARSEGELILKEVLRDRNSHGETVLHVVARFAYPDHGAILDKMMEGHPEWAYQVDTNGISPLDLAIARGYEDVTKRMIGKFLNLHLNNGVTVREEKSSSSSQVHPNRRFSSLPFFLPLPPSHPNLDFDDSSQDQQPLIQRIASY